ncbi:MAG TPA: outer membrane lipoprotein carrier protein LolA, partial [Thermodesulfobacteriota bacterium]|nr:outer membrane lipoprotein carrier protein LolA [Thermodesulfobacteriota bacterium]
PGEAPRAEPAPPAADQGALALAQQVQRTYERTRDLTASFVQEATLVTLGRTQRSEGSVWLKKPGRMRWDYAGRGGREGQVIVSDGRTLWIYNPDDRTVIREEIGAALARTPLAFLMGLGELTRDFEVSRPAADPGLGREGEVVLALAPKEPVPVLQELYLAVDPARGLVTAALIVDPFGNRTRIVFERIRTNVGLPDSRFAFRVPPGVQVVEPPRLP